jgi:DNA-binding MarR family transcriptional regulator
LYIVFLDFTEMADFFDSYGPAFLGLQLLRLYEQVDRAGDLALEVSSVDVPSRIASSLVYLKHHGPTSVAELARALGTSHQLASQRVATLVENNLITKVADRNDRRSTLLRLSAKGRRLAAKVDELCQSGNDEYRSIFDEIGVDVNKCVIELRKVLERQSFGRSVADRFVDRRRPVQASG